MNEMVAYSHRLTKILYTAAAFSLILGIFAAYFYQKATSQNLYESGYHAYQAHSTRGASDVSSLKEAYNGGQMDAVTAIYNAGKNLQPEEKLLAGIAFLEKGQSKKAIKIFQQMIQVNKETNSDFFEADAEYYLAMSYLKNNEPDKAMPIFAVIQSDSENPYHPLVSDWYMLMMKVCVARI